MSDVGSSASESFCANEMIGFFCKQKTAYEMRISGWSSDVCSSDLTGAVAREARMLRAQVQDDLGRPVGGVEMHDLPLGHSLDPRRLGLDRLELERLREGRRQKKGERDGARGEAPPPLVSSSRARSAGGVGAATARERGGGEKRGAS